MFKLILQNTLIGLIFGQISYWDDTRQWSFYFFNFSIITLRIFRIVFYGENDPKTFKKGGHPSARKFENQLEHATHYL